MIRFVALLLSVLCFSLSADAGSFPRGTRLLAGAAGSSQLNTGGLDLTPAYWVNFLPTGSMQFFSGATPGSAALDSNGYPTQSFTGNVSLGYSPTAWTGVPVQIDWTAGTKLEIINGNANSSCSVSGVGGSFTGCGGFDADLVVDGTGAGSFTFTTTGFSLRFPGTGSYGAAGTASLTIRRVSDVGKSGPLTDEGAAVFGGLKTLRTVGWDQNGNDNNETLWAYRAKSTSASWPTQYSADLWSGGTGAGSAGTLTGTDQYSGAASVSTPAGAWTQGEVIQGSFQNSATALITISNAVNNGSGLCRLTVSDSSTLSTSQQVWIASLLDNSTNEPFTQCSNAIFTITKPSGGTCTNCIDLQGTTFSGTAKINTGWVGSQTLTITGKTGTKFIAGTNGLPLQAGSTPALVAGIGTCSYDAVLDRMLCVNGPITSAVPMTTLVAVANQINANLWVTSPPRVDDTYIQNWATAALGLNPVLYFYPEVSNEVWNFRFKVTQWSLQRGYKFGFPFGSNEAQYGYYGLRVRQIMGIVQTAWVGRTSQLRRVMAYQGTGTDVSNTKTYRFEGADLAPFGTSTGKGNSAYVNFTAAYCTFIGSSCPSGADYTTGSQQPQAFTEVMADAPYIGGANLFFGPDINPGGTPTSANATFYQTLVNAWDAPNPSLAISLVADDVQQGRALVQNVTASGTTFTTPAAHGFIPNATSVSFKVTGGTSYAGLTTGAAYRVTGTSTAGCPGAVVCNFTIQGYSGGAPSGANINAGAAGSGTVTVGSIGDPTDPIQTMLLSANTTMQVAQAFGALYSKRVEMYEGAFEPVCFSAAQATSLGLTGANPAASCVAAVQAFLDDPSAATLVQTYDKQFMGTDTNMVPTFGLMTASKTPSWLVLPGPTTSDITGINPWGLLSTGFPNSTPHQTYTGFKAFSSGVN